jgi:hypothetical protein
MSDTALAVLLCAGLFIGLPVVILVLRDRVGAVLWRRRNPHEKLAAERRAYEARLLDPDWEFYERHLLRPAPAALRDLFADRRLIVAQDIDCGEDDFICTFNPIDEQGLIDNRPWLGFDAVAIATTDSGDPIYLRPGAAESDAVYITYHDGGDTAQLAPDVSAFVQRLRNAGCRS